MPLVALATSDRARAIDADLPLLAGALRDRGSRVDVAAWTDDLDWSGFDLVVIRSCWDYVPRRAEFLAWARRLPAVANPADLLEWNTDKTYLRELAADGVPVIPTGWAPQPTQPLPESPSGEWVVKPTVSAGSRDTARWSSRDEVDAHVAELQRSGRTAMVQPYVASVDAEGETALLYLRGTFSHAVRKGPLLVAGEGVRQSRNSRKDLSAVEAGQAQLDVAEAALASAASRVGLTAPPLYARVDVVRGPQGHPLLLELELTEPSLFIPQCLPAAGRFAAAVEERLGWACDDSDGATTALQAGSEHDCARHRP